MSEAFPRREPSNIACVMQGPLTEHIIETLKQVGEAKLKMQVDAYLRSISPKK